MYPFVEQLVRLQKANLAAAQRLAGIAAEGAERLLDAQLKASRSAFTDGVEQARILAQARNMNEFAQVRNALAQPALDNAASYVKDLCDAAMATQSEMSRLVEEQVAQLNGQIVSGLHQIVTAVPADSEVAVAAVRSAMSVATSTYDNLARSARELALTTHPNGEGISSPTSRRKAA